jgi:hypothetical protein
MLNFLAPPYSASKVEIFFPAPCERKVKKMLMAQTFFSYDHFQEGRGILKKRYVYRPSTKLNNLFPSYDYSLYPYEGTGVTRIRNSHVMNERGKLNVESNFKQW